MTDKNNFFANPWLLLAAIIVPVILPCLFVYAVFHTIFFGFSGLIISIGLLYYSLGPENPFYPTSESVDNESNSSVARYFGIVNSQLFTVLFWYLVFGPIAALTYRLISLCCVITPVNVQAKKLTDILEWLPARLTVLLFALAGNFQRGFKPFLEFLTATPDANNKMLSECGLQAVRSGEVEGEIPMPVAESLIEHAVIVFLVFVALFTLVAWM